MRVLSGFLVFSVLFLAGCGREPLPVLPEGVQTLSGVLLPAELSLVRRGTHVLMHEGKEQYFVESSLVVLRNYEQRMVTLRGVLEPNVEPKLLPVLVVDSVVDVEETTRDWRIDPLSLTLSAPRDWEKSTGSTEVQFTAVGSPDPVLTISKDPLPAEVPFGESLVIDGRPAVRIINEQTGTQAVYVLREDHMLTLLFTPRGRADAEQLREGWLLLLSSLSLDASSSSASSSQAGTGSTAAGTPCGGPAGVLCPPGYYCEVSDTVEDIGVCERL